MFYKIKTIITLFKSLLASILLCFMPLILNAQVQDKASISVGILNVNSNADNWLLSAQGLIILNKQQYDALMDGIDITFVYDIEVNEIRKYLWDRNEVRAQIKRELSIHSLSNQFIVRDSLSNQLETFLTLELALKFIARLDNFALNKIPNDKKNLNYLGRLRLYLDIESLPIPMRLPAYIKDEWSLSTDWIEWSAH